MSGPPPTAARDAKVRFLLSQRFGDIERFGGELDRVLASRRDETPKDRLATALMNAQNALTPDQKTLHLVADYAMELEALSDGELDARFGKGHPTFGLFPAMWRLMAGEPIPPEQTFNKDTFGRPNYDHWSRMPAWTFDETLALCLDLEPGYLIEYASSYSGPMNLTQEFARCRDLLRRSIQFTRLPDPVPPDQFANWAIRWNVDVDRRLLTAIRTHYPDLDIWATYDQKNGVVTDSHLEPPATDERPVGTRERETFNKLVIALAYAAYRYDPSTERSKVPSEVQGDLASLELDLSIDTIRKKLKEASTVLSGDAKRRMAGKEM